MTTDPTPPGKRDTTMPVWIAVGVVAVLVGVLAGPGLVRVVGIIGGVCALAYGVGQYLGPRKRDRS